MKSDKSYSRILQSSSIMGGAAVLKMGIKLVETKFAAVLIGTGGVGLLANFTAIQNMARTLAGLGIASSAVRDVATSASSDDQEAIGRAALTLRRICWLTGLLGMAIVVALSPLISQWTFGSHKYEIDIASLGFIVLLLNLSGGQMALIEGMRRIGDIARATVLGMTGGAIFTIGFYFLLGLRGIVPGLMLTAVMQWLFLRFYAGRIPVPVVHMSWRESLHAAGGMAKLGVAMMWSALIGSIATYITVAMINHQLGLQAVGIYSAAFALSGLFVNFVLQAMGSDYYPRLTGVASDKAAMNRLVGEQIEIGLLLAVPGLLATMSLAPWVVHLFYTKNFMPAVDLIHWFILGCFIRVIQWPMGFLQLALGRSAVWFSTQTLLTLLHLAFIWIGLREIGIEGVSVAFFMLYVVSLGVITLVARYLTGFSWNASIYRLLLIFLPVILSTLVVIRVFSVWPATLFGILVTLGSGIICLRELVRRIGHEHRLTHMILKIPGFRALCE